MDLKAITIFFVCGVVQRMKTLVDRVIELTRLKTSCRLPERGKSPQIVVALVMFILCSCSCVQMQDQEREKNFLDVFSINISGRWGSVKVCFRMNKSNSTVSAPSSQGRTFCDSTSASVSSIQSRSTVELLMSALG